jgi:hypothetical protein
MTVGPYLIEEYWNNSKVNSRALYTRSEIDINDPPNPVLEDLLGRNGYECKCLSTRDTFIAAGIFPDPISAN